MANRRFAKLADAWKHLPLAKILSAERSDHYCETHAGNASYPMIDDPERRLGVTDFRQAAAAYPALADSKHLNRLRQLESRDGSLATYPGSPSRGDESPTEAPVCGASQQQRRGQAVSICIAC